MKLLHIVSSLNPIYGGQPEVVKQLLLALSDLGHQSEVLSLDAADNYFPNDKDIIIHSLGRSFGKYNLNFKLIPWLRNNAEHFDAIVCHGIWQFQSFGTWLASKLAGFPYFIYVHGALDPWFKFTYPSKHLKKWLYWPWAEYRVLKSAKAVIFTSEGEKKRAAESFWLYDTSNNVVVTAGIRLPEGDPHPFSEPSILHTRI